MKIPKNLTYMTIEEIEAWVREHPEETKQNRVEFKEWTLFISTVIICISIFLFKLGLSSECLTLSDWFSFLPFIGG